MPHEAATDHEWNGVTTSFDVDLNDVVQTDAGPFAVGGSGTVVANTGDGWEHLVTDGPAEQNRTLTSVAVTDDGGRVWYAGASGAVGMYDVDENEQYDVSYSRDVSASWSAIAVSGRAGTEQAYVANTSGKILPVSVSGREATYGSPATPGGGSEITALEATRDGVVYATDTAGNVYETTESGWTTAGIEAAQVSLRDVTVDPDGRIYVTGANGTLYTKRPEKRRWRAHEVAGSALRAVDVLDGHVVVLSANNELFRRPVDGRTRWRTSTAPTDRDLLSLALDTPDVAVGKGGAVVTRKSAQPPAEEKPPVENEEVAVCEQLVEELLGRLERDELLELLQRREACESTVAESVAEMRTESAGGVAELLDAAEANVVVLPVAAATEPTGGSEHRHHTPCECHAWGIERRSLRELLCE